MQYFISVSNTTERCINNQLFGILWVGWARRHDKWFKKKGWPKKNPIKETHIFDRDRTLSVGVGIFEPAVIRVIGQDSTDLVMQVLTNWSKQLSMKSLSLLNMNQSKTSVIGLAHKSAGGNRNITCTSLDSRNSMGNHSRIGTQGVNKDIFSPSSNMTSNLLSCKGSIKKFDTHVHGSATQERNL